MGSSADAGLRDLEQGRAAYAQRRWALAFKALSTAAAALPLTASDLCALAWSAQLVARPDEFTSAMERAHHAHLAAGDPPAAARCAFWLGFVHGSRGDLGPAAGWIERAARVLGDRDCVERGYLILPELMMGAMAGGWTQVHDLATDAASTGERFGDADLTTFARHWRGRALVYMDHVAEGFALLDETMVAVASGELSPFVTGLVYCSMIEACQEVFDLRRSQEWTRALSAWCEAQPEMVPFTGQCLVHRAELLVLHGEWEAALNEANRAAALADQASDVPATANAHYVLGEVHRLRGEHDDAMAAYETAHRAGRDPLPGLALLRLAQGDPVGARVTLQRGCDECGGPLGRANLLPSLIDALVATGEVEEARVACHELATTAGTVGSTVLAAHAARAAADLSLLDGDASGALAALRAAEPVWRRLDAPYELARVHLVRSRARRLLGDADGAELDRRAALDAFAEVGAAAELERVETSKTAAGDSPTRLSPRELEVLRLVAAGSTNKGIAAELVVSEKTVERHVSNILAKLGVPSRAAATAHAYEHHLL